MISSSFSYLPTALMSFNLLIWLSLAQSKPIIANRLITNLTPLTQR